MADNQSVTIDARIARRRAAFLKRLPRWALRLVPSELAVRWVAAGVRVRLAR